MSAVRSCGGQEVNAVMQVCAVGVLFVRLCCATLVYQIRQYLRHAHLHSSIVTQRQSESLHACRDCASMPMSRTRYHRCL